LTRKRDPYKKQLELNGKQAYAEGPGLCHPRKLAKSWSNDECRNKGLAFNILTFDSIQNKKDSRGNPGSLF